MVKERRMGRTAEQKKRKGNRENGTERGRSKGVRKEKTKVNRRTERERGADRIWGTEVEKGNKGRGRGIGGKMRRGKAKGDGEGSSKSSHVLAVNKRHPDKQTRQSGHLSLCE